MGEWSMSFRREGEQVHLKNQDGCHAVNAQPGSASGSPGRHLGVAVGGGADPFSRTGRGAQNEDWRHGARESEDMDEEMDGLSHAPHMGVA